MTCFAPAEGIHAASHGHEALDVGARVQRGWTAR